MKRILSIVTLMSVLLSLGGCSSQDTVNSGGSVIGNQKETNQSIKIGLFGTLTGGNALAGEMLEKGARLAIKKINSEGGINGTMLELVPYDDKSTPEGAVKAATRLVDVDKVIAMIGSNSSPNVIAGAAITEQAGVIQIGTGSSPSYTNAGYKYLFRGTASGDLCNEAFINAMNQMNIKTVALFSVASEYGKATVQSIKKLLGNDIEVILEETYQQTDTDYTGQISKIIKADPDAVIVAGMTNELALSLRQFRRMGYEKYIYGPEALGVPDIVSVAGDAANNVIFGSGAVIPRDINNASNAQEKEMLEAFVATYGSLPVSDVVYRGYDGVMLIAEAIKNAENPRDPESVRNAFVQIDDYVGIAGTYNYTDESGDGLDFVRAFVIKDGKHVVFDEWIKNQ